MNWSLLTPQFYGFFIFLIVACLTFIAGLIGVLFALWQWLRMHNADLDKRIATAASAHVSPVEAALQKLEQTMNSQHRETLALLDSLPKADTVHAHDTRLSTLEVRTCDMRSEIDEIFRRMRRMELIYAREHGSSSGDEHTDLPSAIPEPPRRPV